MPELDPRYIFTDLSGSTTKSTSNLPNPYDAFITSCSNSPAEISTRYAQHRNARAKQQTELFLAPSFEGFNIDTILARLELDAARPENEREGYEDPRHNLCLWARPSEKVRKLVGEVQSKLKQSVPHIWLMPLHCLHMTALEIIHSQPSMSSLGPLLAWLDPLLPALLNYPATIATPVVLHKPLLVFDAGGLALSFLPLESPQGEASNRHASEEQVRTRKGFTYHHLRRELWERASETSATNVTRGDGTGVPVGSRYVVPSAHLTVGRFVTQKDITIDGTEGGEIDGKKVRSFVAAVEKINEWLEREYWPQRGREINDNGTWRVGEDNGFECRVGRCWYGGGETIMAGKGF